MLSPEEPAQGLDDLELLRKVRPGTGVPDVPASTSAAVLFGPEEAGAVAPGCCLEAEDPVTAALKSRIMTPGICAGYLIPLPKAVLQSSCSSQAEQACERSVAHSSPTTNILSLQPAPFCKHQSKYIPQQRIATQVPGGGGPTKTACGDRLEKVIDGCEIPKKRFIVEKPLFFVSHVVPRLQCSMVCKSGNLGGPQEHR